MTLYGRTIKQGLGRSNYIICFITAGWILESLCVYLLVWVTLKGRQYHPHSSCECGHQILIFNETKWKYEVHGK